MTLRSRTTWIVLGGVAALAIWFFLLTDGRGLVTRMGPYQGKVIDAETGQPVPNAYVIFTWDASSPFGAANCATAAIARSDNEVEHRWDDSNDVPPRTGLW